MSSKWSFALPLVIASGCLAAQEPLKDDSILPYVPNAIPAYVFGALYGLVTLGLFARTFYHRAWWTLCLPIGAFFEAVGFFLRVPLRTDQSDLGLFIAMDLFIVISPAAFLAFNYLVYGRLIVSVDGSLNSRTGMKAKSRYSMIPPRLVGRAFIWSDVSTFLIQSSGGSLEANIKLVNIGDKILLVGIIMQGLSYVLFTALSVVAYRRLQRDPSEPSFKTEGNWEHPTRRLFWAIFWSSTFILIRSVYRIIELGMGYNGVLYSTEIYFLIFDSAPLLLAIGIFLLVWPSALLDETQKRGLASDATYTSTGDLSLAYQGRARGASGGSDSGLLPPGRRDPYNPEGMGKYTYPPQSVANR